MHDDFRSLAGSSSSQKSHPSFLPSFLRLFCTEIRSVGRPLRSLTFGQPGICRKRCKDARLNRLIVPVAGEGLEMV
ncbi:hypothetical protein SAY86_023950 [Trapa natans]|uniref:Uncharacterized protein n=1 Tax=Trapa natans TaxID=22666 RepID=A0AAN7LVR6_TRANT|nr:hypothetical protein SAY86_023950 [Trapa natans]